MFSQRPQSNENEEDILDMQKAYMEEKSRNSNFRPAAKLINVRKHESSDKNSTGNTTSKKSKFAVQRGHSSQTPSDVFHNKGIANPTDAEKRQIADTSEGNLVGDIIERIPGDDFNKDIRSLGQGIDEHGFPDIQRRDTTIKASKISIFAQQMKLSKPNNPIITPRPDTESMDCDNVEQQIGEEALKKSPPLDIVDKIKIDNQNAEMLSNMSEEEIIEEQNRLLSTLDKSLIDFIKTRKYKNPNNEIQHDQNATASSDPETDRIEENLKSHSTAHVEVLSHPMAHTWLHFNDCEREKLQWTSDVEVNRLDLKPGETFEARFDLSGTLLEYAAKENTSTELFHHGDEPHRPGYTLQELFKLCRSQVAQQRGFALTALAGIVERHTLGSYWFLELPLSKIFFMVRFSLDDNSPAMVYSAIKCMRGFFWNHVDEACLDASFHFEGGMLQPSLYKLNDIKKQSADVESALINYEEEKDKDDSEITDYHLAETNLVQCALRTDLLPRIRYILRTIHPTFHAVEFCLEILIRVARESELEAVKLIKCDGLLECIVENFIPVSVQKMGHVSTSAYGTPLTQALKLIRIIASYSEHLTRTLVTSFPDIVNALQSYVGAVTELRTSYILLQIEAMNVWSVFLHFNLVRQEYMEMFPIIMRLLDWHVRATDIHHDSSAIVHSHGAALMSLIREGCDVISDQFVPFLIAGLEKWCTQISNGQEYTCGHLRLVTSTLSCLAVILTSDGTSDVITNQRVSSALNDRYIIPMMTSHGFELLCKNIRDSSCLLMDFTDRPKATVGVPQIGACLPGSRDGVPPTLGANSPFPFLAALTKYMSVVIMNRGFSAILNLKSIKEYFMSIERSQFQLTSHWFTKIEIRFILNLIELLIKTKSYEHKDVVYNICYKLSYILSEEFKEQLHRILVAIVFSKEWFSDEIRLKNLQLDDGNILDDLPAVMNCYINVMGINQQVSSDKSLALSDWHHSVLPMDWPYLPIVGLYGQSQALQALATKDPVKDQQILSIIKRCLQWILIAETFIPHLMRQISSTDRFCRIMCVFLCHNSMFLEPDIKPLLYRCVQAMYKLQETEPFDFDKPLQGLSSFVDLYTQFLEHFQAVSYGDDTFSSCLLVPLAQRHNLSWRKQVWSEHAALLRVVNCTESQLCYPLEAYLDPPETDVSLLICYKRALLGLLRANSIPYKIAKHHDINTVGKS